MPSSVTTLSFQEVLLTEPGAHPNSAPPVLVLQMCANTPNFYIGTSDLNSGFCSHHFVHWAIIPPSFWGFLVTRRQGNDVTNSSTVVSCQLCPFCPFVIKQP